MSERPRIDSQERVPSPEDVRRQLEGRLEMVEAARERYAALASLLSGRKWKRRLHGQSELLHAVLDQEPALDEALKRVERRALMEQWPEDLPVLATVREVRALRDRLEALVHERLGELALVPGAAALTEDLLRLEGLVPRPVSLEPLAGEVTLSQGGALSASWRWLWFPLWIGTMALTHAVARSSIEAGLMAGIVYIAASFLSDTLRRGRYRLTQERFVWKPPRGEPVQLSLRSIAEGGVELSSRGLRLMGERVVHIEGRPRGLTTLALRVELHRHPPLFGNQNPERWVDAVCFAATFGEGSSAREGHVVLRAGYVAFIPWGTGPEVLRAIIGRRSRVPVSSREVPFFIEQLRYLRSEAAFDACVERAVEATRGARWSPDEAPRYEVHTPVSERLCFQTIDWPRTPLIGNVAREQQERAERILSDWPTR